jgi:hypothetical protein
VEAVRGAMKVGILGGTVLYIFAEPLAQLTPPGMGVYRRLRSNLVGVRRGLDRGNKACPGRSHQIPKAKRDSRQDEEMLCGTRERFEINEARRHKVVGEVRLTHSSNIACCQNQVIDGS